MARLRRSAAAEGVGSIPSDGEPSRSPDGVVGESGERSGSEAETLRARPCGRTVPFVAFDGSISSRGEDAVDKTSESSEVPAEPLRGRPVLFVLFDVGTSGSGDDVRPSDAVEETSESSGVPAESLRGRTRGRPIPFVVSLGGGDGTDGTGPISRSAFFLRPRFLGRRTSMEEAASDRLLVSGSLSFSLIVVAFLFAVVRGFVFRSPPALEFAVGDFVVFGFLFFGLTFPASSP